MSVPSVPVRGSIYKFATALVSQADTKLLKSNPTLASGDAKVSTDGAAFANLGTLPTVTPSSDRRVLVTLAASEMGGQQVDVALVDASGAEWCDQFHVIDPLVLPVLTSGTAQSGSTSSTIKLANTEPSDQNDYWKGAIVRITGGTGVGQARDVSASVQSTHVLTVVPNWDTTPDNTSTYEVVAPPGWVDAYGLQARVIYSAAYNLVYSGVQYLMATQLPDMLETIRRYFQLALRKDSAIAADNVAELADINENMGSGAGAYANTTDSQEALRDYTAAQSDVLAITNNTRAVRVVPPVMERPDSGSTVFRIELLLYDEVGNMEAPDSTPTISVVDEGGSSRDANLDSGTMTLVSTGRYRSTYTIDTNHDIEQLIFSFSVTEGGAARVYANAALVVDTTAVDFTSADRADLQTILAKANQLNFSGTDVKATLDGETVVLTDGSLTAAKVQDGALTAAKFGSTVWNKIADHVLRRSWASAAASSDGDAVGFRSLLGAVAKLVNRVAISGSTLTVYEANDTTPLGTQTTTPAPGADPISEVNTD